MENKQNNDSKDIERLFQLRLKLAEEGNSDAQKYLGYCYRNGIGTTKDEEKAFQWYLKSAEGGNITGQYNLGHCYQQGIGITKNDEKAFQWYMKSGNHVGQFNLGYCHQQGIGTTKDEEKTFQWYLKSAEGGNKYDQNSIIHMSQLDENAKEWEIWRWIDYSEFKNIEYLAEGKFSNVWKAEWIDMPGELFYSNQVALKKFKNSQQISSEFLKEIIVNFHCRDRLGDLGLCRSVNEILSYVSDIYSVGIIMWVISTGKIPFERELYDPKLAMAILSGYRPKINKGTPQCYVELMEKCWHNNPSERPSAEMIFNILENWIENLTYSVKSEYVLMFLDGIQRCGCHVF
ncbi:hypothetical protein Glove_498g18 [Diversispora epigaea]|uniref:Protein kinase domain-containing protein n=1 Tax=Diversispora epigaea TaxID=1348612 RepID=A0A397GN80_9GLOM|nr:hypothetical protein Glove_498g18 [Diversispora epigaea]